MKSKPTHTILILLAILLSASGIMGCSASTPASRPTATNTAIPTKKPIPSATITSTPESLLTPTLMPTSDIWEIQKCQKAPSIIQWEDDWIWEYSGAIEGHGELDMLLNFTGNNEIIGFAFDSSLVREYRVNGCVKDRSFTMWLHQGDDVDAVIQGEFPAIDPRRELKSSSEDGLEGDVITGSLVNKDDLESFLVYLRLSSGTFGSMEHRFQLAGTENNDDRTQVVEMLDFPVEIWMNGARAEMKTPEMFLNYYNAIFGNGFKERLEITFPNYLIANAGNFVGTISQLVYGGGGIIFNEDGKVIAIYNWEK